MSSQTKKNKEEEKQRIIIFKEKHGNRYFDASTEEKLHIAALKVLKERFESGWYYEPEEPQGVEEEITGLRTSLEVVKDSYLREQIERKLKHVEGQMPSYLEYKREWETIQKALEENDGNLAYWVLQQRIDCEYEEYDFEWLENT